MDVPTHPPAEPPAPPARPAPAGPPPRLQASGITVRFGGLTALSGADLTVAPARITGLVGPNGAGKSTLFAVLSGLLRASDGRVWMDGADITRLSPQARAARGLARTFQHPELFAGLTVREHLVLAYRMRHARRRLWTDLLTAGAFRRSDPDETARVETVLDDLDLRGVAERPVAGLPLGTSRIVEVGRALAADPSVLLLDEPSSGLDAAETRRLAEVLQDTAAGRGVALLLVEHDVDLVFRLCQQVVVLDSGVRIAAGPPAQVRADPAVQAAYLGDAVGKERT